MTKILGFRSCFASVTVDEMRLRKKPAYREHRRSYSKVLQFRRRKIQKQRSIAVLPTFMEKRNVHHTAPTLAIQTAKPIIKKHKTNVPKNP
ncbi:MAG: hypothetical protein M2R45_02251 [Verrucomicrobia subdivision 3 bacterium]|nr:hypothetical protein [Limisphaerales bacterium]MCS1413963.1 hypothetical protein [Limisphaerales bacterium]